MMDGSISKRGSQDCATGVSLLGSIFLPADVATTVHTVELWRPPALRSYARNARAIQEPGASCHLEKRGARRASRVRVCLPVRRADQPCHLARSASRL